MHSREYAQILLRKAAQDEFTVDKLVPDPDSPDEVIGFHAQQAVEKTLKAVLALRSIRYRRTHDLVELIDLVHQNGIAFPEELEEVRRLGPFATEFRYGDFPAEAEEPFDRAWIVNCLRAMKAWAESLLEEEQGDG